MRKLGTAILLSAVMVFPLVAAEKEKNYQDATVVHAEKYHPNAAVVMSAIAAGTNIKGAWLFQIHAGEFDYGAVVEKRFGSLDVSAWPDNTPVKIRFDVKGGGIATRTFIKMQVEGGKELDMQVLSIKDASGNEYCGKRKCDPESAAKKLREGK